MAEAMQSGRDCSGFEALVEQRAPKSLQEAADVTQEMLIVPKQYWPKIPPAKVLFIKGALASFSCWQHGSPEIIGLLVGTSGKRKDKVECHKIIASRSESLEKMVSHKNIKKLCAEKGYQILGMIQGPEADRSVTEANAKLLVGLVSQCNVTMVFVA